MSLRHVTRRVVASGAAIAAACALTILGTSSLAGAVGPTSGQQVPGAAAAVQPFTAGQPFSSGQQINVVVPPNSLFTPTENLNVVECQAPGGNPPPDPSFCDGNTINGPTLNSNADGSVDFQANTGSLFQVFALPDHITLHEPNSGVTCNLTNPCVLYIGLNQNDFTPNHVFSQTFSIAPNTTDTGTNPGDGTPPSDSNTLVASPTSSVFGQSVQFTDTVSGLVPACTPSGTVTFTNGSTTLGTGTLSGGIATLSTSALPVGAASVTANFPGSTGCPADNSSAVSVTVTRATTTTALTAAPAAGSVSSQSVTLTATVAPVSPGAGSPSGTVTFKNGTNTLGTGTVSGGIATFTTSALPVGSNSITASYPGDGNFTSSTGSLTYNVSLASTTTTLSAAPASPSVFGQSVTFTATVAPVSPATGIPTGTVTFKDGTTTIGTPQALSPTGTASVSTSSLGAASHTITATYGGDTNNNGSAGTSTYVVNQDPTTTTLTAAPTSPSVVGQSVTLTATVSPTAPGAGSPTGTVTFMDGATAIGTGNVGTGGVATLSTSSLPAGPQVLTATYNADGNFAVSTSAGLPYQVNPAGTTSALTSSVNPSSPGQSVTFTDTVKAVAPGAGIPTGTVNFMDGVTNLGPATLSSGGVATFTTSTLALGTHSITAVYGGTTSFNGSTSNAVSQVVAQFTSTTTLTSSVNPSVPGQSVTFTATVTASSGTATGTVTFNDGSTAIGTGTVGTGGVATFATSTLTLGTHPITAVYGGTAAIGGSTSSVVNQVVAQITSATTLTSSVNPSVPGQSVTFTATVTASSGTPTGTVTFNDGSTTIGTGTIGTGGVATFATSTLALGTHPITAVYGGTAAIAGSTSNAVNQVVAQHTSTTTLSSSVNPSVPGQSVTFTATVTTASGSPTGTVTFNDGSTAIGTGTIGTGGVATFATTTLALGNHPITAVYGGSAAFSGSTSSVVNQVVALVSSSTTLTSSVNPSAPGQAVTFTATVTSTGTPAGTVTFNDGSTAIGTGTLAAGVATLTTSTLALGSHPITAVYGGSSTVTGSTSNVVNQVVANIATTTVVTSSANPSGPGQSVTFTATVTPASGATPTGTVTFKDGATPLGTGTLAAGKATFTIATLAIGTHPITAIYGGAGSDLGSTSAVLNQVVTRLATTLVATPQIILLPLSSIYPAVQAKLTTVGNLPVPGETVTFTAAGQTLCSAVTNAAGVAQCLPTGAGELYVLVSDGYTASFAGDALFLPSSGGAQAIVL